MEPSKAPEGSSSRFLNRVALVTGAGSGIGKATARRLVHEGASVAFLGRTRSKLEEASSDLPNDRILIIEASHEQPADVDQATSAINERFGRLDIVVNNAGVYTKGTIADLPPEEWRKGIEVNLIGPYLVTRAALPSLRRSGNGVIVNVSSTIGLKPIPEASSYCVAKAGLVMLTQATALEEAQHGVRALAVCPGVVDTPIHQMPGASSGQTRQFLNDVGAAHLLGRVGTTDEIADLILFLVSDASAWTTGAIIPIDGGISLT